MQPPAHLSKATSSDATSCENSDHDDADDSQQPLPTNFPPFQAGRYYSCTLSLGAGFDFLQQQLLLSGNEDDRLLPDEASRELLRGLLKEHDVPRDGEDAPRCRAWKKVKTSDKSLKTVDATLSDETILQLARQVPSQMSLLASILLVLDNSSRSGTVVSARSFLKTCALTVRPGLVPAHMDAKEMILAALHFLCGLKTTFPTEMYRPPWIRPVQSVSDLDKRVYEKVGDWTLEQILPSVARLEEEVFYASGSDLKWMPRCRFGPPALGNLVEEDLLWLKGQAPLKKVRVVRKTKPVKAVPLAIPLVKSEDGDPVALEATRIVSETTRLSESPIYTTGDVSYNVETNPMQ
jgi:hypothetical protein